jgi:acetylglutamate kinase
MQIGAFSQRLGLEPRFRDGLRVTDGELADVVLMVLAGSVNRTLVRAFEDGGQHACGLTGADGGFFDAEELEPGSGLGFVGRIAAVRPQLVEQLLSAGFLPVIASVAPRPGNASEPFFNINADMAAATLAQALDADALLFLTDVAGVMNGEGEVLPELDHEQCARLAQAGELRGGMQPKIEAALSVATDLRVKIASGRGPQCVLNALLDGAGTNVTKIPMTQGSAGNG